MKFININIEDLDEYVYNSFIDDDDLMAYYDKNVEVNTTKDCIDNVLFKIKNYYKDANYFGVEINGTKEGFFVCTEELLISFGININHRSSEELKEFWGFIKNVMGNTFQCLLYSHNQRAIGFLQKGGMKVLFENITILTNN